MRESKIEREVCAYARDKYDMLTRKLSGELTSGWPDRMVLTPEGYICFIEFKQQDQDLRPIQQRMCEKLVRYGFDVFVCDDLEQGKRLIDYVNDANLIKEVIHGHDQEQLQRQHGKLHPDQIMASGYGSSDTCVKKPMS